MGLTRAPILATVNYSSYPSAALQLIQCTEYMLECYSLPVIRVQCVECVLEDVLPTISYSTHWISTGAAQI